MHAYVGDEVIVTWPVADDPARNARCILCYFAIEHKMVRLGPDYKREFGIVPAFRAGLHPGSVVISQCGDAKGQLAYFGDTMNVAARLCEQCKTIDERLVISGELKRLMTIPENWMAGESTFIVARGRQELVEALLSDRGLICLNGLEVLGCPSQDFDPHNRKLSRFHRGDPALLLHF